MPAADNPRISVVIVNYRVPMLLRECLLSLREARVDGGVEIIVVDNNSGDNSQAVVESEFPEVVWIGLKSNVGFGRACNVGARSAHGEYLLMLNPDTVIGQGTLSDCVTFMVEHPRAGLVGPKILNPDGSLQVSCRRSFPTPLVALYRFTGLSKLFPHSRRFGRYNLTYMDADKAAQVDAISGSFMFMPRDVFEEVGGFDERFFMYGEDLDLCQRIHEIGREVWYNPATQIVHFKGKSSAKRAIRSRAAFYEAMIIFSRKYRHLNEVFLPNWLVYIGIVIQAGAHIGVSLMRSLFACIVDLFIINVVLWAGISLRFVWDYRVSPYEMPSSVWVMVILHFLLSDIYLFTFWYRGIYTRGRYSASNAVVSGLFASVIFMACVYFIQMLAFSRIAFAASSLLLAVLLPAWRAALPRMVGRIRQMAFATGNVLIVGNGDITRRLVANVEKDRSARIVGIIWPSERKVPAELLGYPVLGTMRHVKSSLEANRVDVLLIATDCAWYSHIIEGLASTQVRNVTVRWVPREVLSRAPEGLPETIPLHDFTV
ncbi:MAG: glycosyltransferase [Chitinivibrionales bacterium]|nr:glycosyltransferase [Chitinivibrionales bacterium]